MNDESKVYKIFDMISKKIIVSMDVAFEKNRSWNWAKTKEEMNWMLWNGVIVKRKEMAVKMRMT